MPPSLYNKHTGGQYSSKEEMRANRKAKDNVAHKIRYYRKQYGYDLSLDDYEEFVKHVPIIRNIHKIHDFVCAFDKDNPNMTRSDLNTYARKHKHIDEAMSIQSYLRTLTKINDRSIKPSY